MGGLVFCANASRGEMHNSIAATKPTNAERRMKLFIMFNLIVYSKGLRTTHDCSCNVQRSYVRNYPVRRNKVITRLPTRVSISPTSAGRTLDHNAGKLSR